MRRIASHKHVSKNFSKVCADCSDNKFDRSVRGARERWAMMTVVSESEDDIESSGNERRRGLRISQHRPIKVFESASGRYIGGQTEDVSTTGLRIELPASAPVVPGKIVSIHVGANAAGQSLANRRQMIPARVVWTRRLAADRARLIAGVEFIAHVAAHLDAA